MRRNLAFKKIFSILISISFWTIPQLTLAQSLDSYFVKLQSYNLANTKNLLEQKEENTEVDKGYELVKKAVQSAKTSNLKDDQLKVLYETVYLLLVADPSHYALELVYPLYQKKTSQSLKVISTLPDNKQDLFKSAMRNFIRELKEGNG